MTITITTMWGLTPKIDRATQLLLKFDTATRPFLKIGRRHGYLRNRRQGKFLNSTCNMGPEIVSDMRQGYFPLVTDNTSLFSATVTCDIVLHRIWGPPPSRLPTISLHSIE